MRAGLQLIETRVLPRGWRDLAHQIALFTSAFVLYGLVRGLVATGNPYKPFGDAMKIIDLERAIHVFAEPSIQVWAANRHWLMDAADWIYLNGHFFVTLLALLYIYVRRNQSFYFVRNMLMIAMAIALFGYWLFPTAPPRLLPEWGFSDSVSHFLLGPIGYTDDGPSRLFINPYAAVPSMHVCVALMVGWPMARLVSARPAKIAWSLYPLLVTFVVVATANHYFTDVFLGAATAGISALLAQLLLARARPHHWTFRRAPRQRAAA